MDVIVKPIVTEKMTGLTEKLNRYGFIVNDKANKIQIKKEVEKRYSVTVESINTMNHYGKTKSRFTKAGLVNGRTNKYKKAVVTLAKGDSIDFYSNI